jgi:hypothetical protein
MGNFGTTHREFKCGTVDTEEELIRAALDHYDIKYDKDKKTYTQSGFEIYKRP